MAEKGNHPIKGPGTSRVFSVHVAWFSIVVMGSAFGLAARNAFSPGSSMHAESNMHGLPWIHTVLAARRPTKIPSNKFARFDQVSKRRWVVCAGKIGCHLRSYAFMGYGAVCPEAQPVFA